MKKTNTGHRLVSPLHYLTESDWDILNSYKTILHGIALVSGPNCAVSLHAATDSLFPCIAEENGELSDISVGSPLPSFPTDALIDEALREGKNIVGLYYARNANEHALKCVVSAIRNKDGDLIGALYISMDVSIPLHQFIRNYIPVVDNDLAVGISETPTQVETVGDMINRSIEQALLSVNNYRGLSATERNRLIVKYLNANGIFNIRGAVSAVAEELGVSRYSIYNYLKDTTVAPDT